jgi:hypothetical protein
LAAYLDGRFAMPGVAGGLLGAVTGTAIGALYVIDGRARAAIEEHVKDCDWCLRELAETRRLLSAGPRSPAESTGKAPSGSPAAEARVAGASAGSVPAQQKETEDMQSVTCAACGTANAAGSKFCRECGASLAGESFDCLHCGAALKEGSKFCNQCGRAVVAKAEAPGELRTVVQQWLPESVRDNKWLVGAIVAVLASFAFPAIFLQFLLAAGIMGGAWLLQRAKREMLADLYRAWKSGDDAERDRLLSRLKAMIRTK